ncbi:hypothetical protein AB205_0108180, partial [Aquarana catesbeiana]
IRSQLVEQFKCLEQQSESRLALLQDLQEFFRRKAEIELEYSRSLDKLAERFSSKIRTTREQHHFKKDQHFLSPVNCWYLVLAQTRRESKDHATLNDLFLNNVIVRLSHISEDVIRLFKKSKDIGLQMHEELAKVTNELYTVMKTYHMYHAESINAESKLKDAEKQEEKQFSKSADFGPNALRHEDRAQRRSSVKKIEKMKEKRQAKYSENKLKCTKARNEYLLNLAATNGCISKYYIHDVSDLIEVSELHDVSKLIDISELHDVFNLIDVNELHDVSNVIDVRELHDLSKLIDVREPHDVFNLIDISELYDVSNLTDISELYDVSNLTDISELHDVFNHINVNELHDMSNLIDLSELHEVSNLIDISELHNVFNLIDISELHDVSRLIDVREFHDVFNLIDVKELHDVSNVIDERELHDVFNLIDISGLYDMSNLIDASELHEISRSSCSSLFQKFKEYLNGSNLITKLQAKHDLLKQALGEGERADYGTTRPPTLPPKPQKLRKPRPRSLYSHMLFNGNMELFIKDSGQAIPLVVESCIRYINLYGLQQQGIFRVPGSQVEVNDIKNSFERGEDPLVEDHTERDINSVAGVLKLYFRGLENPLFPKERFQDLISTIKIENPVERVHHLRQILITLPRAVLVVMRYLFAFLNHLSQYSDENMMDPYNLAICFGPTLMPIPDGQDPVSCQAHVNEVIKSIIVNHESIFPSHRELEGPVYEKCMTVDVEYWY